jgi:hypothetical protein
MARTPYAIVASTIYFPEYTMARRAASAETIARESVELATFLSSLTKGMMRQTSTWHRVLKPNGRRLRGIMILGDMWLGRDMLFYRMYEGEARARALTPDEALAWVRVGTIVSRVERALIASGALSTVPSNDAVA